MSNRFPLIADSSAKQIKELASGDTLDLAGNNVSGAGVVTATTFSGNLSGNVTGTVQTAAQPNITSLGALTSVNVSGAANFSGITTVGVLTAYTSVKVGSAVTITSSGIVSATSFDGSLNSSNLTGALPAIDGSALINLNIPTGFNELDAALFN